VTAAIEINVGKGVIVGVGVKVSVDVGEATGMAVFEAITGSVVGATATFKLHECSRDVAIAIKTTGREYCLIRMTDYILTKDMTLRKAGLHPGHQALLVVSNPC